MNGSDGKRTETDKNKKGVIFDKRAWHYAGTAEWRIPESPWTLSTGLTHTCEKAKVCNPIGNTVAVLTHQPMQISTTYDGENHGCNGGRVSY